MPAEGLRVIDFGSVSPLRSQTLWHAVANGVSNDSPPTLSFCRPRSPYVCIGYHRRLDEVDTDWCDSRDLPVYRRMVGGGPVYLDSGQLFFQITVPMKAVPPSRPKALRMLLEPAVEAFRASGIDARLDDRLEITVGDRKVCGYGAGQIGDAAIVVGNLIESFDHRAAASILSIPTEAARAEFARLIQRYVAATPADASRFRTAAVSAYSRALGRHGEPGELVAHEKVKLADLDRKFVDPAWVRGPSRPTPAAWQAKVKAGVWVFAASEDGTELTLGLDGTRVLSARVAAPELNGQAPALARSLIGRELGDLDEILQGAGRVGCRLSSLADRAQPSRI
ncbi:MAG: lipoate--protein ligase family protein [Actinomycetia bacterium]|nr:lipoate--protein ligase family protein [Actinomycetes bacterium]